MPISELNTTLSQLSTTLETLNLTCNGAVDSFTGRLSGPSSALENPSSTSALQPHILAWNIGATHPTLKTLRLIEKGSSALLTDEHLAALPPSLTLFALTQDIPRDLPPIKLNLALLPPHLQSLRLNASPFLESSIPLIPNTLCDIQGSSWDSQLLGSLPPTVTNVSPCMLQSLPTLLSIPPLLQTLVIGAAANLPGAELASYVPQLPSTLTRLSFAFSARLKHKNCSYDEILGLPRTLTALEMPSIDWASFKSSNLPTPPLNYNAPPWPPSLRELSLIAPTIYGIAPPRYYWSYLPSNLKSLRLRNYSFNEPLADDQGYFDTLPRSITEIDIDFMVSTSTFFTIEKRFPPNLKSLVLPTIHPASFEYLPRTLESFKIFLNCLGRNVCPYIKPEINLEDTAAISAFPASLQSLHVSVPPSCFKHLPRTLTALLASHHHGGEVLRAHVLALPRTLLIWKCHDTSIRFAEDALADYSLPPKLETLVAAVPDCRIAVAGSMLAFLPSSLTYLQIAVRDLQPEHLRTLPCRDNLQFAWFENIGKNAAPFITKAEILALWPENALLKVPYGIENRCPQKEREARLNALWARARLFPDPRVLGDVP